MIRILDPVGSRLAPSRLQTNGQLPCVTMVSAASSLPARVGLYGWSLYVCSVSLQRTLDVTKPEDKIRTLLFKHVS